MTTTNTPTAATAAAAGKAEGKAAASYGQVRVVKTLDQDIPLEVLAANNLVAFPGPEAFLYRIERVVAAPVAGTGQALVAQPDQQIHLLDLVKEGDKKVYTLTELKAIRPIGFLIFDRPWSALEKFVEGGIYQSWPDGTLYTIRQGFLVNTAVGNRVYPSSPADRRQLPKLLPVLIPRWLPPAKA